MIPCLSHIDSNYEKIVYYFNLSTYSIETVVRFEIYIIVISATDDAAAFMSCEGHVCIWNLDLGMIESENITDNAEILSGYLNSDYFIYSKRDGKVCLWNRLKSLRETEFDTNESFSAVSISKSMVASCSNNGTIKIWNLKDHCLVSEVHTRQTEIIISVQFILNNTALIVLALKQILIIDIKSNKDSFTDDDITILCDTSSFCAKLTITKNEKYAIAENLEIGKPLFKIFSLENKKEVFQTNDREELDNFLQSILVCTRRVDLWNNISYLILAFSNPWNPCNTFKDKLLEFILKNSSK
jgi:WD40 repeat protein